MTGPRLPRAMRRAPRATCDQLVSGPMWPQPQQACRTVAAGLFGRQSSRRPSGRLRAPAADRGATVVGILGKKVLPRASSHSAMRRPRGHCSALWTSFIGHAPPILSLPAGQSLLSFVRGVAYRRRLHAASHVGRCSLRTARGLDRGMNVFFVFTWSLSERVS